MYKTKFRALVHMQEILHTQCQKYIFIRYLIATKMKFESVQGDSYFSTADCARSDRSVASQSDSV